MQDEIKKEMISLLPRLRAYARAISRSADVADDLVQQCCEKALRNIGSFEPGSRLDLWLFRILRNGWIDQIRARREMVALQDMEYAGQELPGEDGRRIVEARLQLSAVERAMAQLPQEQQDVLSAVCVAGLGYREAAEFLNLPQGTVMSRLCRARLALHQALNSQPADVLAFPTSNRTRTHARPQ